MAENVNKNITQEQAEHLKKIAGTAYSINGFAPTESGWKLTADQICQIIKTWTKDYLSDLSDVTIDVNHKTGAIYAYVWIPRQSKNICNNELNSGNSAINRTMLKYSKELKEYMDKFCAKEDRRIFSEERNLPLAGIRVQIDRFMKLEFDENGNEYGKQFGEKFKRKTRIELTCNFAKGDDGRFGKLQFLQVTKSVRNNFATLAPRPKKSYNAR